MNNCIKTFVNKQNLDRHIRLVHTKTQSKPVQVNINFNYYFPTSCIF